jgi:hypothetical protein
MSINLDELSRKAEHDFLHQMAADRKRKVEAVTSRWLDEATNRAEEASMSIHSDRGDGTSTVSLAYLAVECGVLRAMVRSLITRCIEEGIEI